MFAEKNCEVLYESLQKKSSWVSYFESIKQMDVIPSDRYLIGIRLLEVISLNWWNGSFKKCKGDTREGKGLIFKLENDQQLYLILLLA
jgi:hypothetical protein